MEHVDEESLLPWLRRAKRLGYTLVGVEQTNHSICLTEVCMLVMTYLVLEPRCGHDLHDLHDLQHDTHDDERGPCDDPGRFPALPSAALP